MPHFYDPENDVYEPEEVLNFNTLDEQLGPSFYDIADRFVGLYVSYRQRYVMMVNGALFIPKRKNSSPIPLSNSIICKHLNRRFAVGVFAGMYSSKFICFDVDDGSKETVRKLIGLIADFGIPEEYVYVSSSGGKGYHVEVFFDALVYTEKLRIFYDCVVYTGRLNAQKVEFRPTHKQAIKLPLSVHAKTGNVCWYVNPRTFEPYESMDYVMEIKQFSADKFNELVDKCGLRKPIVTTEEDDLIAEQLPGAPKVRELTEQERQILDGSSEYPDITQPGQRHTIMRAIAVHNRSAGMTLEESTDALLKWWAAQDRSLTTTSDEEGIKDIHETVAWTFSPHFIFRRTVKKLTITNDILRVVLSAKTKSERKFLFLLACFSSVYGRMSMSYERIAKYTDCTSMTIRRLIDKLVEAGYITVVKSKCTVSEGTFSRTPNTYYLNTAKVLEKLPVMGIQFRSDEPLVYSAQERVETDEDGRLKTFIPELEPDGFVEFYYRTLPAMVSKTSLRGLLTRSEMSALSVLTGSLKAKSETA